MQKLVGLDEILTTSKQALVEIVTLQTDFTDAEDAVIITLRDTPNDGATSCQKGQ